MIWCPELPNNLIRRLASYLQSRLGECLYNYSLSRLCQIYTVVPQSSVIASYLFNHYSSDYPRSFLFISFYTDYFTAVASSSDYGASYAIFTNHASNVAEWVRSKSFSNFSQIHTSPSSSLIPINLTSTLVSSLRRNTSWCRDTTRFCLLSLTPTSPLLSTLISYITERCASRLRH